MPPRREEDYLHGYKLGGSMYPLHGGRSPTSMVTDKEEVDILAKEVDCLPTSTPQHKSQPNSAE